MGVTIGWPVYSDEGVLYSPSFTPGIGSYRASLPITNLQDRDVTKVARTTDATLASTKGEIFLGAARQIGCLVLILPNITSAGTVRFYGAAASGGSTYDSGAITPYPAGETAETLEGLNLPCVHFPAALQNYAYWRFEINDTANPAGYLDIARLVVGGRWQPSVNMSYGVKIGHETATVRKVTEGDGTVFQIRKRRRWIDFTLAELPEDEAITNDFAMQRRAGIHGQMYVAWDSADTIAMMAQRSFLATRRELTALEMAFYARMKSGFRFSEEL